MREGGILYHDRLTPFIIHESDVSGRVVRLGATVDAILRRHDYPLAVSNLLAELLVVAAILSSNLKHEGIVTLQMKGNGPIPMMVADAVYGGVIRGYAEVRGEVIGASPRALLGDNAYLAITLDADAGERYQGVVELEGESIVDALNAYFRNSQQLDVAFKLATGRDDAGAWKAGGAMIERLPTAKSDSEESLESWRYAQVMLQTLKSEELLDTELDVQDLLYRLYHEQGVVAYDARPITTQCRCSRERIHKLLLSMPEEDRRYALVDGKVSVHCQFCNTAQEFTPEQLSL
ncbi:MAG: Hsp33 family molecular chaperone HslO [Alphaproteobacteria bacterium]|nr:Hsp33 family molecular chaperone HslO [Alphaproteobacteria bacterium]